MCHEIKYITLTFLWYYFEGWKNYRLVSWWRMSLKMRNFARKTLLAEFSGSRVRGGRIRRRYHLIRIQIYDNWTLAFIIIIHHFGFSIYIKRYVQFLISGKFSSKYFLLWFKMFFITDTEYWTWALQSSIFHQPFIGSDSSFTTETFRRLGKRWCISSSVFSSSDTISSTPSSPPEMYYTIIKQS